MAGGDGSLCRSSAGRWKPLFSKIRAFSPEAANGKVGADGTERGANNGAAPQQHSAFVLNGASGQLLQDGGRGAGPPAPPKSALVTDGQAVVRRSTKRKLTWLHGLVDQEIEPLPVDDEDMRIAGCQKRSFVRRATGYSFGDEANQSKEEEGPPEKSVEKAAERVLDSEAAALKQDREKDVDLDDASSVGFSDSEDEFAEVEELAAKNMRLNQARTRISDVEREANEMDLPLAPLSPLSCQAAKAKSDASSFASSSDGGHEQQPVVTHSAETATGVMVSNFTVLPAGSGCAAVKQLRKQDSRSECSSFADSSDDDK